MTSTHQVEEDDRRVRHLVADLLDPVEHPLDVARFRLRPRLPASADVGSGRRRDVGRVRLAVKSSASCSSRRAPNPVQPAVCQPASPVDCAVPAMSMCAHGVSPTNSARNSAAVIAPALAPPMFLRSATVGVELACGSAGRAAAATPARRWRRPRPRTWSTSASSLPITPATCVPRARMQAPVRVAMSTIASARLLGRQHQRVGHDQPALGVGVDHLDRRAAADRDHVAERHRRARRHVVGAHQVAGDRGCGSRARRSDDIAARIAAGARTCRSSSGRGPRRRA